MTEKSFAFGGKENVLVKEGTLTRNRPKAADITRRNPSRILPLLLQHTRCKFLFSAEPTLPAVYAILSAQPITVSVVPSVSWTIRPTDALLERPRRGP